MPGFIEPELCRVVDLPAGGALWVHEVKFDGYRMQLRAANGRAVMLTRKGLDWTHRYPEIAADTRALPDCVIDGEVVALDEHGISNFGSSNSGTTGAAAAFAFSFAVLSFMTRFLSLQGGNRLGIRTCRPAGPIHMCFSASPQPPNPRARARLRLIWLTRI